MVFEEALQMKTETQQSEVEQFKNSNWTSPRLRSPKPLLTGMAGADSLAELLTPFEISRLEAGSPGFLTSVQPAALQSRIAQAAWIMAELDVLANTETGDGSKQLRKDYRTFRESLIEQPQYFEQDFQIVLKSGGLIVVNKPFDTQIAHGHIGSVVAASSAAANGKRRYRILTSAYPLAYHRKEAAATIYP